VCVIALHLAGTKRALFCTPGTPTTRRLQAHVASAEHLVGSAERALVACCNRMVARSRHASGIALGAAQEAQLGAGGRCNG